MDANGQKFWSVSEPSQWNIIGDPAGLEYHTSRRALRLANQRRELQFVDNRELAEERLLITPQTLDSYGNRAYLNTETSSIVSTGSFEGEMEIFTVDSADMKISDMVMGFDGVLYIVLDGEIVMHDRRERWKKQNVQVPGENNFIAWRLAADPQGGVWVLDRENKKLGKVNGMPLHKLSQRKFTPDVGRPCKENANPPKLTVLKKIVWPENENPVAIACNSDSEVAVLTWIEDENARVYRITDEYETSSSIELNGVFYPYSMQWVTEDCIALLVAGPTKESPVYCLDFNQQSAWPVGDLYALKKDFNNGPFLHALDYPPHYPTSTESRALHHLSFPFYAKMGEAKNDPVMAPLDSGDAQMVWHRIYLEAVIPKGCGIKIWLAATDGEKDATAIMPEFWYEHRFGKIYEQTVREDIPVAVWESIPSELPHHAGFLPCKQEVDIAGLFSVLIQRSSRKVRSLKGRYLHLHVQLTGNGRATPEIFSLRAYGSRFSYVNEYLPELYKESVYLPEADELGESTAADFTGRFVSNFEGLLTNIEDRIGGSYLLTSPQTIPAESLPWLAGWLGYEIDDSLEESVQRNFIQSAADLYRWHGTLRGLKLGLEIATQGAVSGGEIVVLEDFRLRRTFATIIGADLDDKDDPLTAGGATNGNSFIGDSLFIGDENKKEFLALFNADLPVEGAEQSAIDTLFDSLAHRVTILVHEEVEAQDMNLISHIARKEIPAHVEYRILSASSQFLVGMASLVGVDTYLANRKPKSTARIGESYLGKNDFIQGPAALDPRLEGVGSGVPVMKMKNPVAFADDETAEFAEDITLDAAKSRAFGGRKLTKYNWNYKGKGE